MPFTIGNFVQKNLGTTAGLLRSAAVLTVAGVIAGGAIIGNGVTSVNPSANTGLNNTHVASNILSKELTSGCVNAGTATGCVMVIVGATQNGFLFSHSGGMIIGSFASPQIVLSGALMKINGGYPNKPLIAFEVVGTMSGKVVHAESGLTSSGTLRVIGNMSGSALTISGKVGGNITATVRRIPCFKIGGDIGVLTITATGAVGTGACS